MMTKRMMDANPDNQQETVPSGFMVDARSPASVDCQAERWLIVGAGGFGREVYSWTYGRLGSTASNVDVGFLDDNAHALDSFPRLKCHWSGRISDYTPCAGDRLLMAIGDPSTKLTVGRTLQSRGAVFATFVHPSAIIAQDVEIGAGCVICPFAVACCNVRLGDFVMMNVGALVGHDSIVGDGCSLSPHSDVAGQVELERGVFLGCQTVIVPRMRVGEFSRIGAGSVVISHVRAGVSMMGVPAKRINWVKDDDEELLAG